MSMNNPFDNTGFSLAAMTAGINKLPNLYSRVTSIFRDEPINQFTALVEQSNGSLNIVASRERGAPADKATTDKRSLRSLVVPHLAVMDVVLPQEVQGVRAFGSETAEEVVAAVVARKQQKNKNILDQSRERLSVGALKGIVEDADGSILYNLYTEFGITAAAAAGDVGKYLTLAFELDDDATEVLIKCLSVKRHIEANLRGESMTGVRCLCSSGFYDALTTHPKVKEAFKYWQGVQNLSGDYRKAFTFGNITFEEYAGTWTDKAGVARVGIPANQGICFPEGTGNTFKTIVAPGNFIETANSMGIPYYSKMEEKKFGAGYEIWSESNVLPICTRPEVLVTVTLT